MTRLVPELRESGKSALQSALLQRVICSFLGSRHTHLDGWHFSVLYSLESSRLAANSDKFFPLNSWVPQRSFLSSPQNRSPWTSDPCCCCLCLKTKTVCFADILACDCCCCCHERAMPVSPLLSPV
ncbi:serine-rich and transmembrane domain-containing protein 1 isoform X1 [Mus pahari]|uniref:serine-rich and transmembrane domain-containing protein 1 isoform X1 n=1 Tax=Mus pahari TaxID=10093 RepID=UPI001114A551|nr:serine-rich and transmembrane domain-containing protein 1 isoform X1 [Mus pahari]